MRRFAAAGVAIVAVLATGCKGRLFQTSVQPFFQATEAPGDVTGRWVSEGKETEGLDLATAGDDAWVVRAFDAETSLEGHEAVAALVRFGRVGGTFYWDMTAKQANSTDDLANELQLQLHSLARVRLDGDRMELAFLKPEWVSAALSDARLDLAHFHEGGDDEDGSVILTARTADLETFLESYGEADGVFGEPEIYRRVP
jgi:hypothetical protein